MNIGGFSDRRKARNPGTIPKSLTEACIRTPFRHQVGPYFRIVALPANVAEVGAIFLS